MMTDDNSMVALATPTRFLIENGEWNLTPSLDVHHEINPFECNFQRTSKQPELPPLTKPSLYEPNQVMYTSPELEMASFESIRSPPTPPMSVSQSPSSSSFSLSSTSSDPMMEHANYQFNTSPKVVAPIHTLNTSPQQMYMPPPSEESNHRRSSRIQSAKQHEKPQETQAKSNTSGRKRRIVFEGEDAEDRRKKFLERNRVAGKITLSLSLFIIAHLTDLLSALSIAYKCRQKKKNWMLELEQKAEVQNSQNEELRAMVAQLKEESMYLRNLLLSHGNCDCESVQAYLRKTSVEITNNTSPFRRDSLASNVSYYPTNSFNSMPSFSTTSTGLTPFLNTVINKESSGNEPNDYFSQPHVKA
ncbi:Cyclic AMP-responsive element-binding protein 5 [Choanephora cucurbitarum]|uniref:Cyclic AMP-responsive element-binding protein 5 n=1 Tax=Choanephora cucurbitarum TaxID=101091 RepID=A0A1C7N6C2_9FUNG|nr:Cyclic AMP-responsive element-binding protein 5 [Choanephora cucurbitarum]